MSQQEPDDDSNEEEEEEDNDDTPPPYDPKNDPAYPPLQGYEGVKFGQGLSLPPPPPKVVQEQVKPPDTFTDLASLDEGACRDAILQHVNEHCCYGSRPAKNMAVTKFTGVTALHYTLETFSEGRITINMKEPYRGGPVDGPQNGPAPPPWAIPCEANKLFDTHVKKLEVPHTSVVVPCGRCSARGQITCWKCNGRGKNRCTSCHGRGRKRVRGKNGWVTRSCGLCWGTGKRRCWKCGGDGLVTCPDCAGFRQLRCFIELRVTFTNHKEDYILETTDLPDELIREVGGTIIFQDAQARVMPVTSYPAPDINKNSDLLVKSHSGKWPSERILQQRQTLRGVPVTEVDYTWKDVKTRFWVFGNERKVYAPDYPHQCCWGCVIL